MPTKKFTKDEIKNIVFPTKLMIENAKVAPIVARINSFTLEKTIIIFDSDDKFYQLKYSRPMEWNCVFWDQDAPEMEFTKEAVIVKKWIPVMEGIPQLKNIIEDVWDKGVKQHES